MKVRALKNHIIGFICRFICTSLILVLAFAIPGCAQKSNGKNITEVVPIADKPISGEITDPTELEYLWQEYIYNAIATIGNTWEFNSAQEIDPVAVAKYGWAKYQQEHGTENLETDSEDSTLFLFPLEEALKYAKDYFNLDTLDVATIADDFYQPEKQAFAFGKGSSKPKPSYQDRNSWGVKLAKVTRDHDGTLTVILEDYDTYENRRVDNMRTYILKKNPEGGHYFAEGHREFIDNDLVTLTGDVKHFPRIDGFDGDLQEIHMVGEVEGKVLLAYAPYSKDQSSALMVLNPENMKIEKKVNLKDRIYSTDVEFKEGRLILRFKDKVVIYQGDLEVETVVPLPSALVAKIAREPQYDQNGYSKVYFGGYDISADLKRIVYTDEIGLKLIELDGGEEKLLARTVMPKSLEPSRGVPLGPSYHFSPRFVDEDRKVISSLSGYEWTSGFVLSDLAKGTSTTYDIIIEGSQATGAIRYDTGLLFVNQYWQEIDKDNQFIEGYKTTFLDFHTGDIAEIQIKEPGYTGYIRFDDQSYVGQDFAAYVTLKRSGMDRADNTHYLNRINLENLIPEEEIVSITAAEPHILGVLADGRIIFWYQFNPAEKGICITTSA